MIEIFNTHGDLILELDVDVFDYVDLSQKNLSYANLSMHDLSHCTLIGTNLSHADLRKTDLQVANLAYADLSYADCTGADLLGANLYHTKLYNTYFIETDLADTNFDKSDYQGVILKNSDMRRVDLSQINLDELIGGDLRKAILPANSIFLSDYTYEIIVIGNYIQINDEFFHKDFWQGLADEEISLTKLSYFYDIKPDLVSFWKKNRDLILTDLNKRN